LLITPVHPKTSHGIQKNGHFSVIMQESIDQINQRLKAASVPVSVAQNGKYLIMRATLPCKPSDGVGAKRYKVSLGIPASKAGLKRIESESHRLGDAIARGTFRWEDWQNPRRLKVEDRTIAGLVQRFKSDYMRTNKIQESTWAETWQRTFDRLPQSEELTEALVLAIVLATEEHGRSRQQTVQRMQRLASYAGLSIDLSPYRGDYEPEPRDIPSDDLIIQWRDRIPNESWRWVYGMLAAFGIRPSEYFHFEFVDPLTVRILDAKSKKWKTTRSIPPDWAEHWNLIAAKCPDVTGRTFRDYGQRCSRQFNRYKLPFDAYDLRHAFAVRASVVNRLPVSTAASFMGHSVATHTRVYHRWLADSTNQEVYDRLILGNRSQSSEMPT
jgi:integrase